MTEPDSRLPPREPGESDASYDALLLRASNPSLTDEQLAALCGKSTEAFRKTSQRGNHRERIAEHIAGPRASVDPAREALRLVRRSLEGIDPGEMTMMDRQRLLAIGERLLTMPVLTNTEPTDWHVALMVDLQRAWLALTPLPPLGSRKADFRRLVHEERELFARLIDAVVDPNRDAMIEGEKNDGTL